MEFWKIESDLDEIRSKMYVIIPWVCFDLA